MTEPRDPAPPVTAEELDLQLPSGRLHGQRFGSRDDPLVLCVPGLSANMKTFDFMGERLAGRGLQVVALDLRGRGRSDVTGPGTYGWPSHARDVVAAADELGAGRVDVVGHSMGAFVAMQAAALAPGRLRRVVLVDACGIPDPGIGGPIRAAVERLGAVYASVEAYLDAVRWLGTVTPWSDYWERYFRYELEPAAGGVRSRSDRAAVLEDTVYGTTHDPTELWRHLTMPVLLLRAARELLPGAGFAVGEAVRDRFAREVSGARVVQVDANHYGIATTEEAAAAVAEFLS